MEGTQSPSPGGRHEKGPQIPGLLSARLLKGAIMIPTQFQQHKNEGSEALGICLDCTPRLTMCLPDIPPLLFHLLKEERNLPSRLPSRGIPKLYQSTSAGAQAGYTLCLHLLPGEELPLFPKLPPLQAQPSFEALFYPCEACWTATAPRHQVDLSRGENAAAAHTQCPHARVSDPKWPPPR